jgi:hypothetical protein
MDIKLLEGYGATILEIDQLTYPEDEVLDGPEDRYSRQEALDRAIGLAIEDNKPATVVFETDSGLVRTRRRVHGIDGALVVLDGMTIPITAIHCVLFASFAL